MSALGRTQRGESRLAHPLRITLAAVVIVAVAAAGFIIGWQMRPSPETQRLAEATALDAWAPVEQRRVGDAQVFSGTTSAGERRDISVAAAALERGAVVLDVAVTVAQQLAPGQALATLSGEPYFALPEPLAVYRNLRAGDTGKDVASLQTALHAADELVSVTGVVDYDTMQAVERLYLREGLHLGDDGATLAPTEVPWNERLIRVDAFVPVPAGATVVSVSSVGQTLSAEVPLMKVRVGNPKVSALVDVLTADSLETGTAVVAKIGGAEHPAKVVSIGEFQAAKSEGQQAGKPVEAELLDGSVSVADGELATLIIAGKEASVSLAVPLTAIRTNASGKDYVIVRKSGGAKAQHGGETQEHEVTVVVDHTGGGYAAIASSSTELTTDYEVKVS